MVRCMYRQLSVYDKLFWNCYLSVHVNIGIGWCVFKLIKGSKHPVGLTVLCRCLFSRMLRSLYHPFKGFLCLLGHFVHFYTDVYSVLVSLTKWGLYWYAWSITTLGMLRRVGGMLGNFAMSAEWWPWRRLSNLYRQWMDRGSWAERNLFHIQWPQKVIWYLCTLEIRHRSNFGFGAELNCRTRRLGTDSFDYDYSAGHWTFGNVSRRIQAAARQSLGCRFQFG